MSHLLNFLLIIVIQFFFYLKAIHGSVIVAPRGIVDNFVNHRSNVTLPEFNSTKRNGKTLLPLYAGFANLFNTANAMMAETNLPAEAAKSSIVQVLPMLRYHQNLHDPAFPLNVALSTYLLNQTIQPISKLLQEVKLSINNRDENNTRKPQNYDEKDNDEDNNQEEEEEEDYLRVRLLKSKKNSSNFDDSLLLKSFIRASVVEELNKNKLRQNFNGIEENEENNKTTVEAPVPLSTTTTTTTTLAPTLPSSSPPPAQFSGYYGGNAQNTSGISLTSDSYGPPQSINNNYPSYPPYNQMYYGPPSGPLPVYGADQFRPDVYDPHDSGNFAGVIDQWPTYYARGRHQ